MKSALESMLSSKTRTKMLTLFLQNSNKEFYVRELTRKLDERINSVRRELSNLEGIGLLSSEEKDRKKYYSVNKKFLGFKELKDLITKISSAPRKKLIDGIESIGDLKFACLSGYFTNSSSRVDLLIVGEVDRTKLAYFLKKLEKEKGKELDYTIMSEKEFKYRKDLGDGFLKSILDNECIVLIGKDDSVDNFN